MSFSKYSSQLNTEEWLRNAIVGSGDLLALIGQGLILLLPLPRGVRALACVVWLICSLCERREMVRGYRRYRTFRVDQDGTVALQCRDQSWVQGELLTGSVVLSKLAWLRVESEQGGRFAELFIASGQNATDWRRLQVIWRHVGATV